MLHFQQISLFNRSVLAHFGSLKKGGGVKPKKISRPYIKNLQFEIFVFIAYQKQRLFWCVARV